VHSVVLAAAVARYLEKTGENPEGPLKKTQAAAMTAQLTADQEKFYHQFTTEFLSSHGVLQVNEAQRQEALALCPAQAHPRVDQHLTREGPPPGHLTK